MKKLFVVYCLGVLALVMAACSAETCRTCRKSPGAEEFEVCNENARYADSTCAVYLRTARKYGYPDAKCDGFELQ